MNVFVTRAIPRAGLELLRDHNLEVWAGGEPPPREELFRRAPELDGIVTLLTDRMDATFMDAAPRLRVISNYAVGFDNIDLPAATARGIAVGNTPGVLTETTADLAFTLLMSAARHLTAGRDFVMAGRWRTWDPLLLLGRDIHHATLGLIGFGRIGQEMARRAAGFSMRVVYTGPTRHPDDEARLGVEYMQLEDLLPMSDFVSLHAPLTGATRHLIDSRTLSLMKKDAILINTARGPIVDSNALYDALRSGQIGGAALDVTDPEPLPAGHKLLTLDNCLVVPHIGSASVDTREAMAVMAAENLLAGLEARPLKASPNADVVPWRTRA